MRLGTQLILTFWGLAVAPLAAITLNSYLSSLRGLHYAAKQES